MSSCPEEISLEKERLSGPWKYIITSNGDVMEEEYEGCATFITAEEQANRSIEEDVLLAVKREQIIRPVDIWDEGALVSKYKTRYYHHGRIDRIVTKRYIDTKLVHVHVDHKKLVDD